MPAPWPRSRAAVWAAAAPGLELLGLTGLVVAQPVLHAFSDSPETFVSRGAGAADVVLFALCIALVPPLVLWAVEALVGLVREAPRRWLHLLFVAFLVGLLVVQVGKEATDLGYKRLPAAAAVAGLAFAALHARFASVRSWLRLLALAPVVFVVLFLVASPVRQLVLPSSAASAAAGLADRPAPVVVLVLDELPTASLLDADGGVNGAAFPHFARLAAGSTWYRNSTSVAPYTAQAVPAILTGTYPESWSPPIASEHPDNLFSLLGGSYELHVTETYTRLCSAERCRPSGEEVGGSPLGALLGDAADIWREKASPKRTKRVPLFGRAAGDRRADERMEAFIRSLAPSEERPRLDFLHAQLPHIPYHLLPDGREYEAPDAAGTFYTVWIDQPLADVARQRHLLQLQRADQLLGRLLRRLEELGTYDESLVVVTADHGAAFTAGQPLRGSSRDNHHEVMWTPLFVKAPAQERGQVSDRPMRSIDVLPTIADHLGIEVPWDVDGTSALDEPAPSDARVRFLASNADAAPKEEGDYQEYDGRVGYRRMLAGAPDPVGGGGGPFGLFAWGEHGDLVGRPVGELTTRTTSDVIATLDDPGGFDEVDLRGPLPVYVSGEIESDEPVHVAVAVNGVVGGWADASSSKYAPPELYEDLGVDAPPAASERVRGFATMVHPELLRDGDNDVEVFVIEDANGRPALAAPRAG